MVSPNHQILVSPQQTRLATWSVLLGSSSLLVFLLSACTPVRVSLRFTDDPFNNGLLVVVLFRIIAIFLAIISIALAVAGWKGALNKTRVIVAVSISSVVIFSTLCYSSASVVGVPLTSTFPFTSSLPTPQDLGVRIDLTKTSTNVAIRLNFYNHGDDYDIEPDTITCNGDELTRLSEAFETFYSGTTPLTSEYTFTYTAKNSNQVVTFTIPDGSSVGPIPQTGFKTVELIQNNTVASNP